MKTIVLNEVASNFSYTQLLNDVVEIKGTLVESNKRRLRCFEDIPLSSSSSSRSAS